MPGKWHDIPIEAKLFLNIDEAALTRAQASIENAFQNEAGGHTRFPGLEDWATLSDNGRVYVHEWRNNLIAATSEGYVYRIDDAGNVENVTGVPISGGKRVIFASTDDELVMAAGGQIIRFAGNQTEVLSEDAPLSSYVAFIDNYLIAIEDHSGRWYHSEAGAYRTWSALDVFTADANPDPINSIIVTQYREIMACGNRSIEQFDRISSGDTPFFRRWAVGESVFAPYCLLNADNGVFTINKSKEFVRFSGQSSEPRGDDIGRVLEAVDDWTDAWIGGYPDNPLHILGEKFVLLQIPNATNTYGTKGLTFVYDYRQKKWTTLYGWDATVGVPIRWPGWSHWPLWGNVFVGGEGKVYKLTSDTYQNDGVTQRMYGRTAHLAKWGEVRIDNLRARLKRGVGSYTTDPLFNIRVTRDNKKRSKWVRKGLGKSGENEMFVEFGGFGCGHTFQVEWFITDDAQVELVSLQAQITRLGE